MSEKTVNIITPVGMIGYVETGARVYTLTRRVPGTDTPSTPSTMPATGYPMDPSSLRIAAVPTGRYTLDKPSC